MLRHAQSSRFNAVRRQRSRAAIRWQIRWQRMRVAEERTRPRLGWVQFGSEVAVERGWSVTGTPFRTDCPTTDSTTIESVQSFAETPGWRPATFCQGAAGA